MIHFISTFIQSHFGVIHTDARRARKILNEVRAAVDAIVAERKIEKQNKKAK